MINNHNKLNNKLMKHFTFLKSLLMTVALLVGGVNFAWAVDMTTMTGLLGLTDNSNGFGAYHSKPVTLAAGESYVYTFVNYNKGASGTDEWENWTVEATNGSKYLDFRADGGFWGGLPSATNYTGSVWGEVSADKPTWLKAYNGVTVTVTVSRSNDGVTFTVAHTTTLNTNATYAGTYTATISAGDNITFYLTNEDSHQVITNVTTNAGGVEKEFALLSVDHTASSSRNGSNVITTTVDAENEHYNNTKAAAWGGWAYAQFSYTIPAGRSIESATLTWSTTIAGNSGTRDNDIYYVNAGTSIDYAGLTSSYNLNPAATFIVGVPKTGPATYKGIETDVTSAVRTIAATQNYVIFKWTNNGAGADLHGKTSANPPTLELVTTAETFYTATFNANDGALNPSVTVYTDAGRTSPIAKDALSAKTTYYYTAVLEGYNNYEGSFDVETSDLDVNFTMTAKTRYTFTVNAVDAGSNVIKVIYTDADSYEGKTHNMVYPKYLTGTGNVVTYSKDNNTYGESKTAQAQNETYTISYTAYNGVAYFVEVEDVVSATAYSSWNCSNGGAVRGFTTAKEIFTVPATGVYDVTYAICNNNVSNELSCTLSKNETIIATEEGLQYVSINYIKTTGIVKNNSVSLVKDDVLKLTPSSTNGIVDYMLIELKSVPATIGSTGWTTFASAYPLDLANLPSGVSAYYAATDAVGDGKVTVTQKSNEAVATGTGLLLKGTANETYSIPVAASGTDISSGNLLIGCTSETVLGNNSVSGYNNYVLVNNSGTAEFQSLIANGATIPAGKAYLQNGTYSATVKALSIVFEDTATGIRSIDNGPLDPEGRLTPQELTMDDAVFNLAGQRVSQPTRGLYIVNGKKVIVK